MNFKKIIEQQKKLDKAIIDAHSIKIGTEEINEKMIVALFTEIAEFANEVQSFKYWKKTKQINYENMLEEYADGLHFLISFAIKHKSHEIIEAKIYYEDINKQFIKMFSSIEKLSNQISKNNIEESIAIYLGLAKLLNINDDQIEQAYLLKNKKNFERIKNNY